MSPPKRNRQGLSRREWRERQNGAGPSREREAPTYEDISPATSPAPRRRRLDLENERQEQRADRRVEASMGVEHNNYSSIPTANGITNPHGNLFMNLQCSEYFNSKIQKMETTVFELKLKLMNSEKKYENLLTKYSELQNEIKLLKQETSNSSDETEEDPSTRPVVNRLVEYDLSSVSSGTIDIQKTFNESRGRSRFTLL